MKWENEKRLEMMTNIRVMRLCIVVIALTASVGVHPLYAQEEEEEEGIIWGEEEEGFDEDFFGEDEEFFDEGEESFDDEFGAEEEFGDDLDEFLEEDEFLDEESDEEGFEDEEDFEAGWDVNVSVASTAFANSTLATWNSFVDLRAGVNTPFFFELGSIVMRLGAEISTFKFDNYMPEGGKYSGVGVFGIISIPSGNSQLQVGLGLVGTSPAVTIGQSFGVRLNDQMELRFGFRSTTGLTVPTQLTNYGSTTGWLDGGISINYFLDL